MLATFPSSVPVAAVLAGIWRDDRLVSKPTSQQQQLLQPASVPGSQVLQQETPQQQQPVQMTSQHQVQPQPQQALAAHKTPDDSQSGEQRKAGGDQHAVPAASAAAPAGTTAVSPASSAPRVGYSTDSYWNDRYAERSTHFDWFFNYSALASLIRETCERKEPCLHVGCGNSGLSEGMVHDGYQVINVDISGVVIEQMRRMSSLPGQSWEVADCRSMPHYSDASFGSVLDKGTLDAVLCSSHGQTDTVDYMNEVHRLLAPGGTFLLISLGQPHARLAALNVQQPPVVASCSAASGSSLAAAPCSPGSSAGSLTLPYLSETYRAAHAAAAAALAAASGKPASSYSWTWESVQVYLLPKPSLYLASEQSLAGRPSTRTAAHSDKDQPVEWLGPFAPGAELEAVVAEQGLGMAEYFTGFACKKRSSDEQQAVRAVPEGGAVVLPVAAAVVAAAPDGPIDEEEAGSSECIAADQPSAGVPGDAAGVKA